MDAWTFQIIKPLLNIELDVEVHIYIHCISTKNNNTLVPLQIALAVVLAKILDISDKIRLIICERQDLTNKIAILGWPRVRGSGGVDIR